MSLDPRTAIPEPIKREVRQAAGFGCSKCGNPIVEYHHIVARSDNPHDIMLLCPLHHREATEGAMPFEEQRALRTNPRNIRKGYVHGLLTVNQETAVVALGGNTFVGECRFIRVDDVPLVSIQKDSSPHLSLSVHLMDEDGSDLALIDRNEWVSGDSLPWDLQAGFQWLKLRRKHRSISLDVDARRFPIRVQATLWSRGFRFTLRSNMIQLDGMRPNGIRNVSFTGLTFINCGFAANSKDGFASIVPDSNYDKGMVATVGLDEAIKMWRNLQTDRGQPCSRQDVDVSCSIPFADSTISHPPPRAL